MKKRTKPTGALANGFSLTELLVATTIMLGTSVVLVQMTSMFKNQQTKTINNNDITQSALYGIAKFNQSVKDAGNSFKSTASISYGCPIRAFRNNVDIFTNLPAPFAQLPNNIQLVLAPVLIMDGGQDSQGGALPDQLMTMSGSTSASVLGTKLIASPTASAASLVSSVEFSPGDKILFVTNNETADPLKECLLDQVSNVAGFPSNTVTLSNSYTLMPENITNQFHSNNSLLTTYSVNSVVINLGKQPKIHVWALDNNTLVNLNLLSDTSPQAESIADDIVTIQARYGIDTTPTNNQFTIDDWVDGTSSSGPDYSATALTNSTLISKILLQSIKAVRIAMVIRNKNIQSGSDASAPALTPSLTLFEDRPNPVQINIPAVEQKFGYRIFETTIFLRNNTY